MTLRSATQKDTTPTVSWETQLMDEFCVMFERASMMDDTIEWSERLLKFIRTKKAEWEVAARQELMKVAMPEKGRWGCINCGGQMCKDCLDELLDARHADLNK